MLLLAQLFQLFISKTVPVRKLRRGDKLIFENGEIRIVRDTRLGESLISFKDRTAREIIIESTTGATMAAHPGEIVRISRFRHNHQNPQ